MDGTAALKISEVPSIKPVPVTIKKPGYAVLYDLDEINRPAYYSYESLYLYPPVRKGLLYSLSINPGSRIRCACSAKDGAAVQIRDGLAIEESADGHDSSCVSYRQNLQSIISSGYLGKMCRSPRALNVSFSWGKGARNKNKGAIYPGTTAGMLKTVAPDLSLFAGTVATMAYNKNAPRLLSAKRRPSAADLISSLMMEFSRYTVRSRAGKELPLSSSFYVPWAKEPWGVSFVVGRLLRSELVGRTEKFVALSVDTVLPSTFAADARPSRFTVDSALWSELMGLSPIEIYRPGEFENAGLYLVGICAAVVVKIRNNGVYDSYSHSYVAEEKTFIAKRLQTFALLRLNAYGMPCGNAAEMKISESYMSAGYVCSKRLLPLPDSSVPAFVVENDRGQSMAVNYSELSE